MKEELIHKWLNGELSPEELNAFKKLDEYDAYVKLSDNAKHFKAPSFDQEKSLSGITKKVKTKKVFSSKIISISISVAAVLVIGLILFKNIGIFSPVQKYETAISKTEVLSLPDNSEVYLNSNSSLSYNSKNWDAERNLTLIGEALFEVEKGEKFKVQTDFGTVEVLGTVFNVKSRPYAFSVVCYEGSVKVSIDNKDYILKPQDKLSLNNDDVVLSKSKNDTPSWRNNYTILESQPLDVVLEEFKNYYNIKIHSENVDTEKLFTGSFTHNNLKIALNSITLPLGLTYVIEDDTIFLSNK